MTPHLGPRWDEPVKDGAGCDFPHHRDKSFYQSAFANSASRRSSSEQKYSNYSANGRIPLDNS